MDIIRGTTPTIRFKFKTVDPADIVVAYLNIWQTTDSGIEKDIEQAEVGEDYIQWSLSQEETLSLDPDLTGNYECRYRTEDNQAYKTQKRDFHVIDVKKGGVI